MDKNNQKKYEQLGMPHGTAQQRLRKDILFYLLRRAGENTCYQCGEEIEDVSQLSIEHKNPWLDSDNPKYLFFDMNNIAFSHLSCNSSAARRKTGIGESYRNGCRCKDCTETQRVRLSEYRSRR